MRSRLYFPDYAKRLRKRGVTRKTLYSKYIKRYPQGYFYCSFNRFLRAYMASHKSLFKGFDACGPPANHSAKGWEFPHMAKVISQMVWSFRAWRKSSLESLMVMYLAMEGGVVILVEFYCKGMTLNFRH